MLALVLSTLLLGAEGPAQPAKGSVPGFFTFAEAGAGTVRPNLALLGGPRAAVTVGYGGALDDVALSTTFRAELGLNFGAYAEHAFVDPAQLSLTFAVPDAAADIARTKVRFTPIVGVDYALFNEALFPRLGIPVAIVIPHGGGQLERRFGPFELAYRLEVRGLFGQLKDGPSRLHSQTAFDLAQRLFAEVWLVPSFSLAAGLDWRTTWGAPPVIPCSTRFCRLSSRRRAW